MMPDRFWTVDAEVPYDCGSPTGRFFVMPNIVHGLTICETMDIEPDGSIDALGPYVGEHITKMVAGRKNKREGWSRKTTNA